MESGPGRWLAPICNLLAGLALLGLMVITCIDVFGRYLLGKPLTGSTELIELGLGVVVFAALPVITWRNENIVVDILDRFFSARAHLVRGLVLHFVFAVVLSFVGARLWALGKRSLSYGEVTEFLHIPLGWMIQFMGVICCLTAAAAVALGMPLLWRTYHRSRQQPDESPAISSV